MKEERRCSVAQRAVDDVGVPRDPAAVGDARVHVSRVVVEDKLMRQRGIQKIPRRRVAQTLKERGQRKTSRKRQDQKTTKDAEKNDGTRRQERDKDRANQETKTKNRKKRAKKTRKTPPRARDRPMGLEGRRRKETDRSTPRKGVFEDGQTVFLVSRHF